MTDLERIEMYGLAGRMIRSLEYLRERHRVLRLEGSPAAGLSQLVDDLTHARQRIIDIAESLPEGPLEAFAREHPMCWDDLDGAFCGYGDTPSDCPEPDLAKHWDAWELLGTSRTRPESARR